MSFTTPETAADLPTDPIEIIKFLHRQIIGCPDEHSIITRDGKTSLGDWITAVVVKAETPTDPMGTTPLSLTLREHAELVADRQADTADTRELLLVLARVVEGKGLYKSFGAPGNWGYGTPIGDAVLDAIKTNPLFH